MFFRTGCIIAAGTRNAIYSVAHNVVYGRFSQVPILVRPQEKNGWPEGGPDKVEPKIKADGNSDMVDSGSEPWFAVYSARCPMCGTWDVWDVASPLFVNGLNLPFRAVCLVCENIFRVNSLDPGFVSFETRDKGFSRVRPVSRM